MKKITQIASSGLVMALTAMPALAANPFQQSVVPNANGVLDLIKKLTDWFAAIIAAIAVVMILYAAFLFITAGGNEDSRGKAKNVLIWGIIGIAVAFLAYGIVGLVRSFLQ